MSAFLLLSMLLSTAPAAPGSAQCDAKPFTLSKPAPQAAGKPAAETPKKPTEVAGKTVEPKPKPKSKPLADCKPPASKKG